MIAVILSWSAAAMAGDGQDARMLQRRRAEFDRWVARLQQAGLLITADGQQIERVTSEAAYFMYAQRKDHQPRTEPFRVPDKQHWLAGKPVLAAKADKQVVYPLFMRLVQLVGYDTVWIYAADVHYGVSSHARFTLYKLGHRDAQSNSRNWPQILLGDGDYVLGLP
jgi:hypothetical protein